ncbi:NAD(P)H-dependent glycerol-3-phosphate dehydrogenase [Propionibacteriaceae bacterium Y1685]|uniref:NAD(P)H-dependent glycerol-3-phosphate dehydrogenase n=1 Tax=Microlunatus sp. Y1700 TaxID=3418487 RepID=UPI003B80A30D
MRIAVMGAGSWGTAFGQVLCDAGQEVTLWSRRPEVAAAINDDHRNHDYLPGLDLPAALGAVSDPRAALDGAEAVVVAVPSQTLRENLSQWRIDTETTMISLAKGIELGTGLRMSQVIEQASGHDPNRLCVVSGPNLAREIAERQPCSTVVASPSAETAAQVQQWCHTRTFRAYTNTDVIGCELGGATKNVIAIAVGAGVGLGMGHNALASLITRGLAEITRLGLALGAAEHTFAGLAGLGDLVATCNSPLSRNRTFGEALGKGRTVDDILASTRQVAEGVKSCRSIVDLARAHDVEMPIAEAVVRVVEGAATPVQMLDQLLSRSAKPER